MSELKSRREVLKGGLTLAATAALPSLTLAQQPPKLPDITAAEKQLAKPLTAEVRKILDDVLKANQERSVERLKTKLPENSEPCFSFSPRPREKRTW